MLFLFLVKVSKERRCHEALWQRADGEDGEIGAGETFVCFAHSYYLCHHLSVGPECLA